MQYEQKLLHPYMMDTHARTRPSDHGHALGNGAVLVLHGEHPAPAGIDPLQKFRELPTGPGPEHQVDMAIGFTDLLRPPPGAEPCSRTGR